MNHIDMIPKIEMADMNDLIFNPMAGADVFSEFVVYGRA
jgi:hypothetical protein